MKKNNDALNNSIRKKLAPTLIERTFFFDRPKFFAISKEQYAVLQYRDSVLRGNKVDFSPQAWIIVQFR